MLAIHPGEILREEYMAPLGLSANALAIALGIPGDFANERHINAVAHVLDVCKKHGKLSVMFCGSAEAANGYFKQGFDSVTVSLDISVMADAFVDVVKKSLA